MWTGCAATWRTPLFKHPDLVDAGPGDQMWITVKYSWGLTLQSSEKSVPQTMLNSCSS
ncbi:hypothetical protein [Micromonospora sp. DT47]|uniref:hypothetical protein n=1 Tax=Micromonospora sp. DT47 TaxID=3393431 RepID=UPI003CEDF304